MDHQWGGAVAHLAPPWLRLCAQSGGQAKKAPISS